MPRKDEKNRIMWTRERHKGLIAFEVNGNT